MDIKITERDVEELRKIFPDLSLSITRQQVWGTLSIQCSYDENSRKLSDDESRENFLQDKYEIRIDFNKQSTFGFPRVEEESEKIKKFSINRAIKLNDLHVEDDDSCCLGVFPEYKWQGVCQFIIDKLIPYFYWQTFRRVYGREPWAGLAHGVDGIREQLQKLTPPEARNNRNSRCNCGSGLKYKRCCMITKEKLGQYLKRKKRG